jgi:hypothetical protein
MSTIAGNRPVLPPDVSERFIVRRANVPQADHTVYRPAILGTARVHFAKAASGISGSQSVVMFAPIEGELTPDIWSQAEDLSNEPPELESEPEAGAAFAPFPSELSQPKHYDQLAASLKDFLYRHRKLVLFKSAALKQTSSPGESEAEFRIRLTQLARERRDTLVDKLRQKYAPKIAAIEERIRKAQVRVEKEQSQASQQTMNTVLSFGSSILSALFGRKLLSSTNVTRAASSMRQAGRIARERQDIADAGEGVAALEQQRASLNVQFEAEISGLEAAHWPDALVLEEVAIAPKKSDITVQEVCLVWRPAR